MKLAAVLILAAALIASVSRAAEKREEQLSPLPSLARALEIIKEKKLPYDPQTWSISIQRRSTAWIYDFRRLPLENGRMLPGAIFVLTLSDDGEVKVVQGL